MLVLEQPCLDGADLRGRLESFKGEGYEIFEWSAFSFCVINPFLFVALLFLEVAIFRMFNFIAGCLRPTLAIFFG